MTRDEIVTALRCVAVCGGCECHECESRHTHRLEGGGCRNVHKKCSDCRRELWMQEVE